MPRSRNEDLGMCKLEAIVLSKRASWMQKLGTKDFLREHGGNGRFYTFPPEVSDALLE